MSTQLQRIQYSNQYVLTTEQLAQAYGTDANHINVNFSANRGRYTEGEEYFLLQGETLKQFKDYVRNSQVVKNRAPSLYLWTEYGAMLHAKSLNTDEAWNLYKKLVREYFRLKQEEAPRHNIHQLSDALRARALRNMKKVPHGYYSSQGVFFMHLFNWESEINQKLDDKASIEISVGIRWAAYAKENNLLQGRIPYQHEKEDGTTFEAWAYPLLTLHRFELWLWNEYFPEKFKFYVEYRNKKVQSLATIQKGTK